MYKTVPYSDFIDEGTLTVGTLVVMPKGFTPPILRMVNMPYGYELRNDAHIAEVILGPFSEGGFIPARNAVKKLVNRYFLIARARRVAARKGVTRWQYENRGM